MDELVVCSGQIRAARAMLRWSQSEAAEEAGVSSETIKRLERMEGALDSVTVGTLQAIQTAFEDCGIEFTSGHRAGVHWIGVSFPPEAQKFGYEPALDDAPAGAPKDMPDDMDGAQ